MINTKNNDFNDKNNDVTVAGTDFFADSESFLTELTDSELAQIRGGAGVEADVHVDLNGSQSGVSLLIC